MYLARLKELLHLLGTTAMKNKTISSSNFIHSSSSPHFSALVSIIVSLFLSNSLEHIGTRLSIQQIHIFTCFHNFIFLFNNLQRAHIIISSCSLIRVRWSLYGLWRMDYNVLNRLLPAVCLDVTYNHNLQTLFNN